MTRYLKITLQLLVEWYHRGILTCLGVLKIVHFNGASSVRLFTLYRSSFFNIPHLLFVFASFLVHIEVKCMQPVAIKNDFINRRKSNM